MLNSIFALSTRPAFALALTLAATVAGCGKGGSSGNAQADAAAPVAGLSAEQAAKVVARLGDRTMTLGEFATALERMDQFDRLRYQTKERRRELLGELVNVELLAAEAKKRGLDKDPEVEDQTRVILRDAMLAKAREGVPNPAQITQDEVRAYYDGHADKFSEPERRRVAAIVMTDKAQAQKVLKDALKTKTPAEWGELFFKSSVTAPKTRGPNTAVELAGDLGIVGPPDDAKGGNDAVPAPVRAAVFKLPQVGAIAADVVEADGKQYIVRMNGITASHHRSMAEADRSIRVLLVQEKLAQNEKALEDELRRKFPVQVDDKALAAVKVPQGMEKWFAMDSKMWPDASGAPAASGAPTPAPTPAPSASAPK